MNERHEQLTAGAAPDVVVVDETNVYDHHTLCVTQASLRYRRSDGHMSDTVSRLAVRRQDAVAVLLYHPYDDSVTLVRQFRYPVYAALPADAQRNDEAQQAWLLEIVAGVQEEGHTAEETARRELREEVGYEVPGALHPVTTVYMTPGYSTERITIFLAEVDARDRRESGGGLESEGEDTQQVRMPFVEAWALVEQGVISDAKTVLALQHLALRKARSTTLQSNHE
jgi:ADP-ribose pyrophosphatase